MNHIYFSEAKTSGEIKNDIKIEWGMVRVGFYRVKAFILTYTVPCTYFTNTYSTRHILTRVHTA